VSDAGTPAVSDPGSVLVSAARAAGVTVTPLPGPSAPVALLSAAGFAGETAFLFRGFFPRKPREREAELRAARACALSGMSRVFVWFESPERIADALAQVASHAAECEVVAAKELSKLHERFFAGPAAAASEQVSAEIAREGARGEWSFALRFPAHTVHESSESSAEGAAGAKSPASGADFTWESALRCVLDVTKNSGISASEVAKKISQHFGVAKRDVYERALVISGKKISEGD
jgi:16S rRNA (cytidine1402-2'-O)-methyltransferase